MLTDKRIGALWNKVEACPMDTSYKDCIARFAHLVAADALRGAAKSGYFHDTTDVNTRATLRRMARAEAKAARGKNGK